MSTLKVIRAQLGLSATPANNYVWRAMDDGALRLSRGNAGAESADILVANADGTFTALASPPQLDSSLKLATTAFVQSALGNMAGYGGLINANTAIAAAGVGKFYSVSGAVTASLPTPTAALAGATIELIGIDAANNYTVNVTGGSNIAAHSSFNAATLVCRGGSPSVFRCTGTAWQVVSGAERYRGDWASLQSGSGYYKLPSGIIVQWGGFIANTSGVGVGFPIIFPTAALSLSVTFIGASSSAVPAIGAGSIGPTGFNAYSSSSTPGCQFMAIGC